MPSSPLTHFAQLNIARMLVPTIDDPVMADFVAQLDSINALAEASPGFVWRLQGDDGNATGIKPFADDRIIVNLSVWETVADLMHFAYQTAHTQVLRARHQWFERLEKPAVVIWPLVPGQLPTAAEAKQRLEFLHENGPSTQAFDFKYWQSGALKSSLSAG